MDDNKLTPPIDESVKTEDSMPNKEVVEEEIPTTSSKASIVTDSSASVDRKMNVPLESDDFDDEDNDDDDDEEDFDSIIDDAPTVCLFCENTTSTVEAAIEHLEKAHEISLKELKAKFQMDQYSFIKLINCVRDEKLTAQQVKDAKEAFWLDDKYMKPKAYETWLTYDFDDLDNNNKLQTLLEQVGDGPSIDTTNLRKLVKSLQERVDYQSMILKQATEDMDIMRTGFRRVVENETSTTTQLTGAKTPHLQQDDGYFNSYAHFGIHQEMLSDTVRTNSYRDALFKNKTFIADKDVLDVGCGTAILSIFASQAGAKTVTGIDNSDIVYNAMDIVRDNIIKNVTLIKGRLEHTDLPLEKYDIIISEWMGYFLLFECMLDTIIYTRDKYLKLGGYLLPNRCTMSIIGYGNDRLYNEHINFWNDVYGLDMSVMRKKVLKEPLIEHVTAAHILTEAEIIADFNINVVDLSYTDFTYEFNLKCTKNGKLSAFVGYFDTFFDLPEPVWFGTSPNDAPTHWKQVVFFLNEPKNVKAGDVISGKLSCARSQSNRRSLDVSIEIFEQKHSYYLD